MRILVVEDNPKMAAAIEKGLRETGFEVDVAHRGFEAEELACARSYDLVVLDRMLPDREGLEVCRNLRTRKVAVPILVLTALSGTKELVTGLDAGADDYLAKPFEFEELLARIRALLRRGQTKETTRLFCGDLALDLTRRKAARAGKTISLSTREFELLDFLMRNPERILDRPTIAKEVWDMTYEPSSNVIDVYISALRKKIDKGFDAPLIHTVVGTGYRFGPASGSPASGAGSPAGAIRAAPPQASG